MIVEGDWITPNWLKILIWHSDVKPLKLSLLKTGFGKQLILFKEYVLLVSVNIP